MLLDTNGFLTNIKSLITGGGKTSNGDVRHDAGFLVDTQSLLGASVSAAAETALPVETFVVPRDYDEATDVLSLTVQGQSAGATDTPALTVTVTRVRVGAADSVLTTAEALFTASTSQQSATIDLSSNSLQRGDVLSIAITAGAHATDALDQLAAFATYRSTLVSYRKETSAGVNLR